MRRSFFSELLIGASVLCSCAAEMSHAPATGLGMYERLTTPEGTIQALEAAFSDRQCELFAVVYDPALASGNKSGTGQSGSQGEHSEFEATVAAFEELCATAESVEFSFTPRRVDMGASLGYPASEGYVTILAESVAYRIFSPEKDECCRDIKMEGGRLLFVLHQVDLEGEQVWRVVHERDLGRAK